MRLLIFILLKLIEISAIVFVPYWVGRGLNRIYKTEGKWLWLWYCGSMHIAILILTIAILHCSGLLKWFLDTNWHLAGKVVGL